MLPKGDSNFRSPALKYRAELGKYGAGRFLRRHRPRRCITTSMPTASGVPDRILRYLSVQLLADYDLNAKGDLVRARLTIKASGYNSSFTNR